MGYPLGHRSRRQVALIALAVGILSAMPEATAQDPRATLWVTLGDSDQLVEIDAYTFKEIRRITTDPRPHGLAASPDGSKIYIGSDRTGNFQVIDARSGKIEAQIPLGKDPNQMTLTKDGRFAYMPMRGENSVADHPAGSAEAGEENPDERGTARRVHVGGRHRASMSARSTATRLPCSIRPRNRCCTRSRPAMASGRSSRPRDGRIIYTALSHLLGFVVVDPGSRSVTRRVELAQLPDGVPKPYLNTYTHALQLVKNDAELWVTDCINDLVRVVRHERPQGDRADPRRQVSALVHGAAGRAGAVREPVGFARRRGDRHQHAQGAGEHAVRARQRAETDSRGDRSHPTDRS